MEIPIDLYFTKEHEWARAEGKVAVIGITAFAVEKLGDITYVELPGIGDKVSKEDTFGVVESVKAVSDLFAPVSGKVLEVNEALINSPEILAGDAYGEGWMIKVEMSNSSELDPLMRSEAYKTYCEEEK